MYRVRELALIDDISLCPNQFQALDEVRRRLFHDFNIEAISRYSAKEVVQRTLYEASF